MRELVAAARALRRGAQETPVLSLGGGAAVPADNRSGASTDQQILRLWLDGKRSVHTRKAYARDILLFNNFLASLPNGPRRLVDVNVQHLEAFVAHLHRTGQPERTAARRLSAVKSLLTFAQQTGYLQWNVGLVVKQPAFYHNVAERILTEAEVHACIYASPAGRNRTILRFLYSTGCRVAELTRVAWRHLHYRDNRMIVQLFGKGKRTRYVPIPLELRSQLEPLRKANLSGHVFETRGGHKMTEKDVWRIVRDAASAAGITRRISPHCLRHSHASHALARGADIHVVQQTLGHTNIRTTADYLHIERGDSSAMYLDPAALGDEP